VNGSSRFAALLLLALTAFVNGDAASARSGSYSVGVSHERSGGMTVIDGAVAGAARPTGPRRRPAAEESARAAADRIRAYYAAIEARDYRRAYSIWGRDGASSGKTYRQFAAGFARTAHVRARIGTLGAVEGAAGSRYVEVPVTVLAVTRSGARQRFTGRYVMRRVVVEGATAAQRRWHIEAARLRRAAS
jgi:hypothetical protein